jgi:AcrR family transcriptional regulator
MRYVDRAKASLRDELLDATAALLVDGGWAGLTVGKVADRVGVSRQTVYNEFGDKPGLVTALAVRETERFCDGVDAALASAPDPHAAVLAAVSFALRAAGDDPLVKAVVHGDDALLPLVTSRGEPVLVAIRERLRHALSERWPEYGDPDAAVACDAVARLVVSHLVLPLQPPDEVARDVARAAARLLGAPVPEPDRKPRSR